MAHPREKEDKGLHNLEDAYTCLSCFDIVEQDAPHLKCPQHHAMCSECAHVFTESVLGADLSSFPPSCPTCRTQFSPHMFEQQLNAVQTARFDELVMSMMAMCSTGPNEILAKCPFCSYFEVREKSVGAMFMWCKEARCQKVSCVVCKLQCDTDMSDSSDSSGEENSVVDGAVISQDAFEQHAACAEMATIHQKVVHAIGKAQGQQCPSCGVLGRKDDACTHMSCVCGVKWCYVCCTDITQLNELADHNKTSKRCAMYMEEYSEVDEDWPSDGADALDYFHRRLAYSALHEIYMRSPAEFERLTARFPAIIGGFDKTVIQEGVAELPVHPDWEGEIDDDSDEDEDLVEEDVEEDVVEEDVVEELEELSMAELRTKATELGLTNEQVRQYGHRSSKSTYIDAIRATEAGTQIQEEAMSDDAETTEAEESSDMESSDLPPPPQRRRLMHSLNGGALQSSWY